MITRSSGGEQVWRVTPQLEVGFVFESLEPIDGVSAGPAADEVWLGGRSLPLHGTVDAGRTWVEVDDAPSVGCLERHEGSRWVCADNWADGTALARADVGQETSAWEPVLWFGDVHRVALCGADSLTAEECEPLWADLDPESGMDLESPAGDEDDTGGRSAAGPAGGCCASEGTDSAGLLLLPIGLLGWGRRRRLRHPAD